MNDYIRFPYLKIAKRFGFNYGDVLRAIEDRRVFDRLHGQTRCSGEFLRAMDNAMGQFWQQQVGIRDMNGDIVMSLTGRTLSA